MALRDCNGLAGWPSASRVTKRLEHSKHALPSHTVRSLAVGGETEAVLLSRPKGRQSSRRLDAMGIRFPYNCSTARALSTFWCACSHTFLT